MVKIGKISTLPLILLTVCAISQRLKAETSVYVFDSGQSIVVKTGGFAGVHETYSIIGQYRLSIDSDAGVVSFETVDANLADETGAIYGQSLDEIFNMTGLARTIIDDSTIEFEGKTADGMESDVRLMLSFIDGLAHMTGNTTPSPNSADMFFYDVNAIATKKYAGGTGEPNDPYQIATAEDLITFGETPEDYYKHFILTADIDLDPNLPSRKVFEKAVIAGIYGSDPFCGVFNGNAHVIRNLHIEGYHYLGLFGRLESGSEVKDLGVVNVKINGKEYIGGLVADNCGIIVASYSTGTFSGNNSVGGLVGSNDEGSISTSYSTGTVSGYSNVGGLAGTSNEGSIYSSYSTCTVIGEDADVGGLVGMNWYGNISGSYSTGTVSGDRTVGGLVGDNYRGSISISYSTGMVSGNNSVGGLVGENGGYVSMSFWDTESSGIQHSNGGVGLTTTEMKDPEILGLNGLAADPNWVLDAYRDYPRLVWEGTPGNEIPAPDIDWLDGNGTAENPYIITEVNQLLRLSKAGALMDRSFQLLRDLDLDGMTWPQAVFPYFNGQFDGQGHVIRNLSIQGYDYLGLFGFTDPNAAIRSLGIEDANVICNLFGSYAGSLVGWNWGSISTSYSSGTVSGLWHIGGLVGISEKGTVSTSYSTCTVSGSRHVGGLVGNNHKGSISHSYSTGMISGGDRYVGGLVGNNYEGSVLSSYSTSPVIGNEYTGGLAGINVGTVSNCYSTGTVSGDNSVGGLVGQNNEGVIVSCYSIGTVNGENDVGGLVGYNYDGSITTSYNTGIVSGYERVGGLVGLNGATGWSVMGINGATGWSVMGLNGTTFNHEASVTNCYSSGMVSGDRVVGGLVGLNVVSIATSYSTGAVSGNWAVGGLVGNNNHDGKIISSFWNTETSDLTNMCGSQRDDATGCDDSYGKTTAEMQMDSTFLDAGWDFVNETDNGTVDIWRIFEGQDYPRLSWEQVLVDDFEDGEALPLWQIYEADSEKIRLEEINGRLEVLANDTADDIVAGYISNGWRLDVTSDFALRADFHFSKTAAGDSWVMLLLLPSLDEPAERFTVLEAGCLENQTFYLHEIEENGSIIQEASVSRSTEDGTLYISYDAEKDELYMSYTGYGKPNAWQTVEGLLQDQWAGQPVYVVIGGGSDQVVLDTGDAYLDNFAVDTGLLDFMTESDDNGDI